VALARLIIILGVIQGGPVTKSLGEKMAKAKAKKPLRREWTKDDVRQMKTMAKAKSGVAKIAKALKRTPGATTVMAAKLGVSLSMRD
jgi:Na+/glutamate symporter